MIVAILVIGFICAAVDTLSGEALTRFTKSDTFAGMVGFAVIGAVVYWIFN